MARFTEIGTAMIPGKGTRLRLLQRNDEFSIKIAGTTGELMNSRIHGSEDALATLACERIADQPAPRVLIGGLGMGFTLAAPRGTVLLAPACASFDMFQDYAERGRRFKEEVERLAGSVTEIGEQ